MSVGGGAVAFGLRLRGVPERALGRADKPQWPQLRVHRRVGPAVDARAHIGDRSARFPLGAGEWLELDRDAQSATYRTTSPLDDDTLIHPSLAPAAAVTARWLGREAFHAGSLLTRGGAWALAGGNEAGKSTLLAAIAVGGTQVLADDLLVVDPAGVTFAGPRCIDLREGHLIAEPARERLRPVRGASRRRMDLAPVAAAAPLRGWIFLEWGSRVEAVPCPVNARFGRLLAQRRWAAQPIDPRFLLDLAALPAWTLRRPRGAAHVPATMALLRDLTGDEPAGTGVASRRVLSGPAAA
jgi:hypothetical protein